FLGITHVGWLMPPPDIQLHHLLRKRPELASWLENWKALPTDWRIRLSDPEVLIRHQREHPGHRARQLQELVENLREIIREKDGVRYSTLVQKRLPVWYSEVVVPTIRSLLGGEPARLVAGLPNKGRLPALNPNVQVECWAVLNDHGFHPEPLPENARCQEDIVRFGQTRDLAFAAMIHPDSCSLELYARSDSFACNVTSHLEWQKLLDSERQNSSLSNSEQV
ncbi:MAG: hypothetical protein ONB45_11475, partial [candidate division KSB1 bacterium]|nr:hypothetical protein [candidate division KSB1 bacterium]